MKKELYKFIYIFFITFLTYFLKAQELPFYKNFDKKEYNSGAQNWSISVDRDNTIYFGNHEGLLRYNGTKWDKFILNNGMIVRSVLCVGDKIYSGGYGEFGFWQSNNGIDFTYKSLKHLIGNKLFDKEEIWHILEFEDKIFFQSFSMLFVYDGQQIKQIKTPGNIMYLRKINHRLIIPVIGSGLYEYFIKTDEFKFLQGTEIYKDDIVSSILPLNNANFLISSNNHAVLKYDGKKLTNFDEKLNKIIALHPVNAATIFDDKLYLATISNGLVIYNLTNSEVIEFNKNRGLLNNTILACFIDKDQGLWLGLDKGICYLNLKSNIKYFKDETGTIGTIYTVAKLNGTKFIGTNQGLYFWKKNKMEKINDVKGQVWDLFIHDDKLFCGHNNGTHLITENNIEKISNHNGGWQMFALDSSTLLQCTYNGLLLYKKNKTWKVRNKLDGIDEPIERMVMIKPNQFLISGPIDGIKKIELDDNLTKVNFIHTFTQNDGLPSLQNLDLTKVKESIFIKSNNELYEYAISENKFRATHLKNVIKRYSNHKEIEIYDDSIHYEGSNYMINASKEYGSVVCMPDGETIICNNEGYLSLNSNEGHKSTIEYNLVIDYLTIKSIKLFTKNNRENEFELQYEDRDFTIYFHEKNYELNKKYRYQISTGDNSWSEWSSIDKIELKGLSHGKHNISIQSNSGNNCRLTVIIKPPFYLSDLAKFLYLIGLGFLIYQLKLYYDKEISENKKKLEEENARLIHEHKIELDNERLRLENLNKSRDLVIVTDQLIKKNDILIDIRQELIEIRKTNEILTLKDFQKMVKSINDNVTIDDDHKLFEKNFNEVHEVLFKKLLNSYPELTPQDLKLAAYLKMNLSSKELAALFNISIRGMENKRYRLRKKLGLDAEENLTEFFIKFE